MNMEFLTVKFTRDLTTEEKQEIMSMHQGSYFNLSEVFQNGYKVLVKLGNQDIKADVINKYKKYDCIFS